MSALELAARFRWTAWGAYAKTTTCSSCGHNRYCRAVRRRGPWLCLECWDLSPYAETLLEKGA